jgi:CheY-like chemotaxis protein/HPt (histidine-containing phosphotransfer) domain-containing protein
LKGSRILLVEDNEINRRVVVEIFRSTGVTVDVAEDGRRGIESLKSNRYDAVLMDVQMPGLDGYETTRMIREDRRFSELPIIAMTANAMKGDREKCLQAGMNDYISKPIDTEQLFSTLKKWVVIPEVEASTIVRAEEGRAAEHGVRRPSAIGGGDRGLSKEGSEERGGTVSSLLETIEGIDIDDVRSRLGGNEELLLTLLKDFMKKNANVVGDIRNSLDVKDFSTAERIAHTLKGVSGNIGAYNVFTEADRLVTAIREEDHESISAFLRTTEEEVTALLGELQHTLDPDDIPMERSSEHTEGPVEKEDIEELFGQCKTLLSAQDIEAEDVFEALKDKLPHSKYGDAIDAVSEAMQEYDFERALKELKKLASKLSLNI